MNGMSLPKMPRRNEEAEKTVRQYLTNIVPKKVLQQKYRDVSKILCDSVATTAGPKGAVSIIPNPANPGDVVPTKDGHSVIKNIDFMDNVANVLAKGLKEETYRIVETVGDGTTTTIMATYHFIKAWDEFVAAHPGVMEFKLEAAMKEAIKQVQGEIIKNANEFQPVNAYDVCMISTDGNAELSAAIAEMYETVGNDVFIKIDLSTKKDGGSHAELLDGMLLRVGMDDYRYANMPDGTCRISSPMVYAFQSPIADAVAYEQLSNIIQNNILIPMNNAITDPETGVKMVNAVPTVIFAPSISDDMHQVLEQWKNIVYNAGGGCPLLIINLDKMYKIERDAYEDIIDILGGKWITKGYIDPVKEKEDVEAGITAGIDNAFEWGNPCRGIDIICDAKMTKIIMPKELKTGRIERLIAQREMELKRAKEEEATNYDYIAKCSKRVGALKNTFANLYIQGTTLHDTSALKDLAEDAVLNCRSCAQNGYGYGTMFETVFAVERCKYNASSKGKETLTEQLVYEAYDVIYNMAKGVVLQIYAEYFTDPGSVFAEACEYHVPMNLRTGTFFSENKGDAVITSIFTDVEILNCISSTVLMTLRSNQIILPSAQHNNNVITMED